MMMNFKDRLFVTTTLLLPEDTGAWAPKKVSNTTAHCQVNLGSPRSRGICLNRYNGDLDVY